MPYPRARREKDSREDPVLTEAMRRIAASLILVFLLPARGQALVSTNVPLDHWSYQAVDKLANYGLIDSAMLTVKPISRVEMARHIERATQSLSQMKDPPQVLSSIVDRLTEEFKGDLILIGALDGAYSESFVKLVEDPYVKFLHADRDSGLENIRGDTFESGSNYRAGFASRIKLWERAAFYLHPEFRAASDDGANDVRLIEGYGKLQGGPFEVQVGKDSLWWGPGYRGSMLMSNNARPLTMVKVTNPQPMQLPWLLRNLGPFRAEWFLSELEEDRVIPEAMLSGIRLNFKPLPVWEVGFSRVFMFGGKGRPSVDLFDYAELALAMSNQEQDNQIAGFDTSVLFPLADIPCCGALPLRSVRLYIDAAGEDEAGGIPSNWGMLGGIQLNDLLKTGRTDLRIEYADNHVSGKPNVFYNHSLYQSGYTYKGRMMGHYMGTDSRDVFAQLSHYLTDDIVVHLSFDRLTHNLSAPDHPRVDIYQCDLTTFSWPNWQIAAGYRYEDGKGGGYEDNHIFQVRLIRDF
jgi:hypothetical protein